MNRPYVIGITGGSGSGKTTLLKALQKQLPQIQLCVISQDHYYKEVHLQPRDAEGYENYDVPESIDIDAFLVDILQLLQGKTVTKQEYNFNNPEIATKALLLQPAPIIVLEGLFLLHYEEISRLIDYKIFMETTPNLRLARRLQRDQVERGHPINEIYYRMEHHVEPAFQKYIEPHKFKADLVVDNNHELRHTISNVLQAIAKNTPIKTLK